MKDDLISKLEAKMARADELEDEPEDEPENDTYAGPATPLKNTLAKAGKALQAISYI
jgi:hypothetical protein